MSPTTLPTHWSSAAKLPVYPNPSPSNTRNHSYAFQPTATSGASISATPSQSQASKPPAKSVRHSIEKLRDCGGSLTLIFVTMSPSSGHRWKHQFRLLVTIGGLETTPQTGSPFTWRMAKNGSKRNLQKRPSQESPSRYYIAAGWSSPVAREAHNLEVVGSNPAPATYEERQSIIRLPFFVDQPTSDQ